MSSSAVRAIALAVPIVLVCVAASPALGQPTRELTKIQVPTPTPTPASKALLSGPKGLPVAVEGRLRAAGLDPADPQLKSKLASKYDDLRRSLPRAGGGMTTQPMNRVTTYGSPLLGSPPAGARAERILATAGPASLEIVNANLSIWEVGADIKVRGSQSYLPADIRYKVTGPCGLDVSGRMGSATGWLMCCFWHPDGSESMHLSGGYQGTWKLGGEGRTVTLALSAPGLPTATKTFNGVWGSFQHVVVTFTVDSAPPFVGANEAGLEASSAKLGGTGPRSNDGTPWAPTSGEDTLGLGVFLGAGYTVSETKVTEAHSKLDPPGYGAPDNAYRYARVTRPPQAGRLQTGVQWMYGPAESLSYTVRWTLLGPMGQRPLSTLPKSGPCDN
jgi:hypothetical protein